MSLHKQKINPFRMGCSSILLLVFPFFSGCDDGGGGDSQLFAEDSASTAAPASGSAPKISGTWTGVYVVYGGSDAYDGQTLTAKIQQDGDAVVINTTLPATGRFLTGTIKPNGDMKLTDALDGELWTTHFEPATTNSMRIADFLKRPSFEDSNPPIAVIELSR